MRSRGLAESSIDELVAMYADAAAAHGRASIEGDHTIANEQHDIVADAYRELGDRGSQAQNASLTLLDHPDPAVRGWAGAHALEFSPEDGERALTDLVAAGGLAGFNAEMTLKTWRKGNLHFP